MIVKNTNFYKRGPVTMKILRNGEIQKVKATALGCLIGSSRTIIQLPSIDKARGERREDQKASERAFSRRVVRIRPTVPSSGRQLGSKRPKVFNTFSCFYGGWHLLFFIVRLLFPSTSWQHAHDPSTTINGERETDRQTDRQRNSKEKNGRENEREQERKKGGDGTRVHAVQKRKRGHPNERKTSVSLL